MSALPRHPCRPALRRRDKLSAAVIALSIAALADQYLVPILRAPERPAAMSGTPAPARPAAPLARAPERPARAYDL